MDFSALSGAFGKMEGTSGRLELTDILVGLFRETPPDVTARVVYMLQGRLRPGYEGVELGIAERSAVRAIARSSGEPASAVERAFKREGDLGAAASVILEKKSQSTLAAADITVERVYDTLMKIAGAEGPRSQDLKVRYVSSLLNDADATEAKFILKLLLGTLRLGVAENTIMDALAVAHTGSRDGRASIEAAYNVSSDLGSVAEAAALSGAAGAEAFGVEVHRPVRPMLAERARDEAAALAKMGGECSAEYKLDGERVQVHVGGGRVSVFSRSNEEITQFYPDIVERAPQAIGASEAILEGEAVAMNADRTEFLPFQELMHRRKKHGIDRAVLKYPISVNFFDVLYMDGVPTMGEAYTERRERLEALVRPDGDGFARCMPREVVRTAAAMADFVEESIAAGCEGIMLKSHKSPYRAGSRGSHWLKLKREYRNELGDSLDLVVIGGFFGRGRRTGSYGTLLLATYDADRDMFSSICKVGTGFTDEDLDRLYQMLSPRVVLRRDARVESGLEPDVWFAPEVVIEIVASEITLSPTHLAAMDAVRKGHGLALRFPKFTGRVREEKSPEDASSGEEAVALYRSQVKSAVAGGA